MNIFTSKSGHFVVPKFLLNLISNYLGIALYNAALISADGNFQEVLAQC